MSLFDLKGEQNPVDSLQGVLQEAIGVFKPASDIAYHTQEARHYEVLYGRYVEQRTQYALAVRLSISPRHLRREQAAALRALAEYLALRYDLFEAAEEGPGSTIRVARGASTDISREMLWLAESQRNQVSEIAPVLEEALELARGLVRDKAVDLLISPSHVTAQAAIPGTVLKQVLLNLLAPILRNLPDGSQIALVAWERNGQIVITITATEASPLSWHRVMSLEGTLDVSCRMLEMFGGNLGLREVDRILAIKVIVPCAGSCTRVLAIEDNVDTLQLWERYVQGTRFSLVRETNGQAALERAIQLNPQLIVLDVMLQGIDGWELLRQFRAHPDTAHIPIIVCTVLPQHALALSLGASDFIQKPVVGREFRAVLERQSEEAVRRQAPQ